MVKKKKTVEQTFREKLAVKWKRIEVPVFLGMARHTTANCECGNSFTTTPKILLKVGCEECSNVANELKKWRIVSIEDLRAWAANRLNGITILAKHKTRPEVKARCLMGHTWKQNGISLLANLDKCPVCTRPNVKLPKNSSIKNIPSVTYTYQGRTLSLTAHAAQTGTANNYLYVLDPSNSVIELRQLRQAEKAYARLGYKLHLGVVVKDKIKLIPKWKSLTEEQIAAFLRRGDLSKIRILSMDPGVTNFAWSVIEVRRPFKVKVLASGMIHNTLTELAGNPMIELSLFRDEVQKKLEEFNPEFFIAERYMSRGMGGDTIELVNTMLGMLTGMWTGSANRFKLIPAAQWKNRWNSIGNLEDFYTKTQCVVHQTDSTIIGIYGASLWLDENICKWVKRLEKILPKQLDSTNREGKKANG